MSVLFECTCSQTILKTYIISYYILHIICMETKRKTAYLCFLYFREWRDPIQNRRRKCSFTSLIEAYFKFKYPASLNPRFTTILHLCTIEVVLKLSTKLYRITSGSQITSILQNSTIPDNKPWVPEAFLARFPVAAYVLYCDPREKPLDQSAIALMPPSQWLACLNRFSPEFGSGV